MVAPPEPHDELRWTDWPATRQPARATVAGVVSVAFVGAVGTVDPWLAVLCLVLIVEAVGEVLLPTAYALTPTEVSLSRLGRHRVLPWTRFARWRREAGTWLLEGAGPSRWQRRRRTVRLRRPADTGELDALLAEVLPRA